MTKYNFITNIYDEFIFYTNDLLNNAFQKKLHLSYVGIDNKTHPTFEVNSKININKFLRTNTEYKSELNEWPEDYIKDIHEANKHLSLALEAPNRNLSKKNNEGFDYNKKFRFLDYNYTKTEIHSLLYLVLKNSMYDYKIFKDEDEIILYIEKALPSYLNSLYKSQYDSRLFTFNEMIYIVSNLYFKFLHNNQISKNTEHYFNLVTNQPNNLDSDKIIQQLQSKLTPRLPFNKYNNFVYTFSELKNDSSYMDNLNQSHGYMYSAIYMFVGYLGNIPVQEITDSANPTKEIVIDIKDSEVIGYISAVLISYYHLNFLPGYAVFIEKIDNINTLLLNNYNAEFNSEGQIIRFEQLFDTLDACYNQIISDLTKNNTIEVTKKKTSVSQSLFKIQMDLKSKLIQIAMQTMFQRQFLSNNNKNKTRYKDANKHLNRKPSRILAKNLNIKRNKDN